MNELIEINTSVIFDTNGVRIVGTFEEPWFVAKDICKKLGLGNTTNAIKNIPEKWRSLIFLSTLSGDQNCNIINESGLYHLIMRATKPEAVQFREWVCEEVLPSLRKKGKYELDDQLQQKLLEQKREIEELKNTVDEKQESLINLKKTIKKSQGRFTFRHKFPNKECVYILQDPDCKFERYKIGRSNDINTRLASDRTVSPNIKIRFLMYTDYSELFEKVIKVRCREKLELQAHEWVFDSLTNLIQIYKEINQAGDFGGTIEKYENLCEYNLENLKPELKPSVNVPASSKFQEDLHNILPTHLLRYEYEQKNKTAPEGQRWCNGFCQVYRLNKQFNMRSKSAQSICTVCLDMLYVAKTKIDNKELTETAIRKDPTIIMLKMDERICRKCNKVLNMSEFPEKRRQCSNCRNKMRSKFGDKFNDVIDREVETLGNLSATERLNKLPTYTRDELHKILQYLKLGRKYNDTKQCVIEKIAKYYEE